MRFVEVKQAIKGDLWYIYPTVHNYLGEVSDAAILITKPGEVLEEIYDSEVVRIYPCSQYTAELVCPVTVEKVWLVCGIPTIEDEEITEITTTDMRELTVPTILWWLIAVAGVGIGSIGAYFWVTRRKRVARPL